MGSEVQLTEYGNVASYFAENILKDMCVEKIGIQTGPFGSQLHKEDYVDDGTPIITVEHLAGNRISHQNLPMVSDDDKRRLSKYHLEAGDVVFSRVGSVDRNALVGPDEDGWLFSGRCLRVRVDQKQIDSVYLSYFFSLEGFKEHIRSVAVGATMPSINTKLLSDVVIYSPPLPEQKSIAHILGSLDDKIELNRRMNETLEGMAQALFKSWFVDFDPVIDNAIEAGNPIPEEFAARAETRRKALADGTVNRETAKQFPSAFQQTDEMGWIPEGWEVKQFGELCKQAIGGQWGEDNNQEKLVPAICLRGCDMADISLSGFGEKSPVRFIKSDALAKRTINPNELLIAGSGAGPCGRPMWCSPSLSAERYGHQVIYSNFVKKFTFQTAAYAVFAESHLMPMYKNGAIGDYINGTSVPNLDANGLLSGLSIATPNIEILDMYFDFYISIDQQKNNDESRSLANLRDTLLPKLISGELRIEDAEQMVEAD